MVDGGKQPRDRTPLAAVLAANSISTAGTSLTLIGVPWFVLETTGSAGRAGVVAFCATLPIVVAALIGGPVIDRIGRRRVSIASDTVCGAAIATIPLLHHAGALHFWMLCALMALNGLAHTPGNTARYVLVPDLAEHAGTTLARAASLFDAVSRGARMVGAALAGVLIAFAGAETVLLLDAASFALSALLVAAGVRGIRSAEPSRTAAPVSLRIYRAELREGYAYLLGNRLLLAVVLMVMFMNGTDQGWNAVLLPVHAEGELGGAADLGMLTALFGRVSGALTAGCELAMPVGGLAAGLLVEGMGATRALLAMGGVYFLATLSPLVFPAWRTMEGPEPQVSSPEPCPPRPGPVARTPRSSAS
ncbi:MFS transporter [Streptomyces sp. NPDC051064]|uniref:MFS transporter n=1 Tax=Streptomyces sp. NPDC051064 TaxID=3365641 RepID=UPI0037A83B5B